MEGILIGALAGLFVAGTGYLKSVKPTGSEDFDLKKFGTTVVIGALAGLLVSTLGITQDAATLLLMNSGIVVLVDNALKSVVRRA